MKKKTIHLIIAFSIFVVLVTPVKAQGVEGIDLLILPSDIKINTTETRSINLLIINNQNFVDTISLSVWPPTTWSDIGLDEIRTTLEKGNVNLPPGSNATVRLSFTVASSANEAITTFIVTAKSIASPNVSSSKFVNIRVVRKTDVYISGLTLDKYLLEPEECVLITTTITNFGSNVGSYRLQTDVKTGSLMLTRFDDFIEQIEAMSMKTITKTYCFEKHTIAGTYTVEVTLKNILNKFVDGRSASVRIKEESNIMYEKSVSYTPFAQTKTIKVKNEGNVLEYDFYVTETVSEFISKFFYPETQPASFESVDGKVSYRWLVDSLEPGQEVQIKYEIRFFSIWFSGLLLIILIFFAFTYVYRPTIKKTARAVGHLKRGKEISVLLELKNSTIHEIKTLVITDSIPPIVQLDQTFETIKPTTKKTEAGTELTWKIKSLQPLEERVLTYRIKPVVDVIGSIKLPSATVSYVDNKKQKKTASSHSVEIK